MKPCRLQKKRRMILKLVTAMFLAMVGMCVNVDVVNDGPVVRDGPAIIVSVVPTIKTMATMEGSPTTTSITTQNAIGAKSALKLEREDGLIPQSTSVAIDNIPTFVPNDLDRWDLEQKRKVGLVSGECPIDRSCHGDEERWLSHLPTLGELIDQYFEPKDREFFTWLAMCESSAERKDIYSDAIHKTSKATGWFQHLPKFWEERSVKAGFEGFPIDHPVANVGVAAWLFYEDGGAKHWKACTKRYLREVVNDGD
tara:strand:- start:22 stop:783 length:762 start_codon:yes stop_codon:yes gene_type:complete